MLRGIRVYSLATCLLGLLISAFWSRTFGAGLWLEDALFLVPRVALIVVVWLLVSENLPAASPLRVLVLVGDRSRLFCSGSPWGGPG
ncbi:hypothetical protein C1N91_02535 [Curtobacterium sp. SGAir0471]|nr:hypothetical protein C1N91_02535 [Curtobacterium sp. SGAir0471]